MAAEEIRPPWFGHRGVQLVAAVALLVVAVRAVLDLLDGDWAQAFLNFCWGVLFGYALLESRRYRRLHPEDGDAGDPAGPAA